MDLTRAIRLAAAALALTLGCATAACSKPEQPPGSAITPAPGTPQPSPSESAKPRTDPLTGGRVSGNEVFAVKIENTAAARPQVGLGAADIVVVEEVEARLTRLIGIYSSSFPRRVGPVRSARNTDARLLPMFGRPGLVYSGANRKVQRKLRESSLVPIERSDRDSRRPAPHNVMVDLSRIAKSARVGTAQDVGFTFAAEDSRWRRAEALRTVKVRVGADTTTFDYRAGGYAVSWNGRPNVDGDTRRPVRTDNVLVLSVRNRRDRDSTSSISVVSETVGTGTVALYRDGKRLTGTWTRRAVNRPMTFRDGSGTPIPLKPGKSWMLLQA